MNLRTLLAGAMASVDIVQLIRDRDWWTAIWAGLLEQVGRQSLIATLGTFYFLGLWWWTGSIFPPAIVLALYGGSIIMGAPAPVAITGGLIVTVAVALSYYAIFGRRF